MNLEQMKAALAEKQKRAEELKGLITGEKDTAKLEALAKEAETNANARAELTAEINVELRKQAESAITKNPMPVGKVADEHKNEVVPTYSKRGAISLLLGCAARKHSITDVQARALGTALTTTADTFVAATESVNGVNNGGIFIKTNILLDLLAEEKKLTPIMDAIIFKNVPGLLVFPYRESRGSAEAKAEGKGTGETPEKWAQLSLVAGYLQIKVPVTDELLDLTDFDFGTYLADQIVQDLSEDWSTDFIYGTGASNHIAGITLGLTAKTYTAGKELATLEASIKSLKGKYRNGAVIYCAQDLFDTCRFAKNSDGDYIVPFFSNDSITVAGALPIKVDETLKDGEFIIGNVGRFYIVNLLNSIHLETKRDVDEGITTYVAKQHAAGKAVPNAFVYGKAA